MKKLIPIVALLSGCVTFTPTPYDPVLYGHLVELHVLTTAAAGTCGQPVIVPTVESLSFEAAVIAKYTEHTAVDFHSAAVIIKNNYDQFARAYSDETKQPTEAYCKIKMDTLQMSVDRLLKTIGSKAK